MRVFPLLIWLCISCFTLAQKPPNFKMTDTEGNDWELYSELSKGNSVILDFFFVDCKPCQEYTPLIQKIYESNGSDTGQVIVFGISNRDDNSRIKQFEKEYGVTYPSCGHEGGGDTITDLYQLNYSFLGWPTYAVICPDTSIAWNLTKTDSFQVLKDTLAACPKATVGLSNIYLNEEEVYVHYDRKSDNIEIFAQQASSIDNITIYNNLGRSVHQHNLQSNQIPITVQSKGLAQGLYYIELQSGGQIRIIKLLIEP